MLRVTGLFVGNLPGTVEFPAQMASYAENVSTWWRHHGAKSLFWFMKKTLFVLLDNINEIIHWFSFCNGPQVKCQDKYKYLFFL